MSDIIELNEKSNWDGHVSNTSNPHSTSYGQVGAINSKAVYYPSSTAANLDVLTDPMMLLSSDLMKGCPIGGTFMYVMQLFYQTPAADANRIQIAFPYNMSDTVNTIAMRTCSGGTWTDWFQLASFSESGDFLPLTGGNLTGDVTSTADINAANLTATGDIIGGTVVGSSGGFFGSTYSTDLANTYTTDNTGRIVVADGSGKLISKTPANLNTEMTAAAIGIDYSTAKLRGISAGSWSLTPGSSELASGQIHIVYE